MTHLTPADLDRLDAQYKSACADFDDVDGHYCPGCEKLLTRCVCANLVADAYPQLAAEIRRLWAENTDWRDSAMHAASEECGIEAHCTLDSFRVELGERFGATMTKLREALGPHMEDSLGLDAILNGVRGLREQVERIETHPWDVLREILDRVFPESVFPTTRKTDEHERDAGPRIVALTRWVDELRAENGRLRAVAASFLHELHKHYKPAPTMDGKEGWPPSIARIVRQFRSALDAARGGA